MTALATVEDLEALTGEAADQSRAERLIEMASAVVERYCRRRFAYVADDEVSVVPGSIAWSPRSGRLRLPSGPVVSVADVSRGGTTYASTSYWLDGDYLVLGCGVSPMAWDRYRTDPLTVTYSHGFETIPDEVAAAVCAIAGRTMAGTLGVESESMGAYSVGFSAGATAGLAVSDAERTLLRDYRIAPSSVPMVRA